MTGSTRSAGTRSDPSITAAEAVLRELCWPPEPGQPQLPGWSARDVSVGGVGVGDLLETAIMHKMLCLLADRLTGARLDRDLPRAISRFLAGTLRTNQYKTWIYRAETARIMAVLGEAGLTTAALNGIAAESSLYGGTGARQFTDLDLLLAPDRIAPARAILLDLGYHCGSPETMTFTRHLEDILVPRITIDLTSSTHHATGDHEVREILGRRCWQPLPGHYQSLPVLAAPDALQHCLARLHHTTPAPPGADVPRWVICADALRLVRACQGLSAIQHNSTPPMSASAEAGWARLRRIWPQLPPMPLRAGAQR